MSEAKPYTVEEFKRDARETRDEWPIARLRATVEALERVTRERDEARADFQRVDDERIHEWGLRVRAEKERDEARAAPRSLPERQRELCARAVEGAHRYMAGTHSATVRATPLVTDAPSPGCSDPECACALVTKKGGGE